jgi:hypothetical protein
MHSVCVLLVSKVGHLIVVSKSYEQRVLKPTYQQLL